MALLHPEADLQRNRTNLPALITNLYNQGLTDHGCAIAYMAALYAGAHRIEAWEAARRHQLLMLVPLEGERLSPQDERGPMYATSMQRLRTRIAARRELIDRIRALPNPFAEAERVPLQVAA